MTNEVRETITVLTQQSPDVETGGVLIGFADKQQRAVAVGATGPGPDARRTKDECRRDVEYVQGELDRAAKELGTRGTYIGEWHSHLVPAPVPSPRDIDSLLGISEAPNYLTRCPVMVIAGFDPRSQKVTDIGSWVFPIGGRMYPVANETVTTMAAMKLVKGPAPEPRECQ